jgi:tetratricopeptide (TPR) repeat protein
MVRHSIILILLFGCLATVAQKQPVQPDVISQLNQLLSDSKFNEAIALADKTPGTTPLINLEIQNKKAEALIKLGKLDDGEKLIQSLSAKAKETKGAGKQQAIIQTTTGLLRLNQGRIDLAIEELQAAIENLILKINRAVLKWPMPLPCSEMCIALQQSTARPKNIYYMP